MLSRLSQKEFAGQIAAKSSHLFSRLGALPEKYPHILEPKLRGRGLIAGLGLKNASQCNELVGLARNEGVFLLTAGSNAIRLIPSLNIEESEIDLAVDTLDICLSRLA